MKPHAAAKPYGLKKTILLLLFFSLSLPVHAAERVVHLVVGYKMVHFAGKLRKAIAVNNQIPAPTLHFKQGDQVSIHVHNQLDKGTAIHWHGMIVPWQMDGVEGVTQKGIPQGSVFHYRFRLRQSGTYWYHAHAGLQEQEGLYGAFIIDPPKKPTYHYNKDFVVVLSDWSNTSADNVLKNLKKDGDYYAPKFPLQPSLVKFLQEFKKAPQAGRKAVLTDYQGMQRSRMGLYDLSDIAYDALLLNGHPSSHPWSASVKVGDMVRLRFIGAAASSIFNVKIPGTKMQIVHVQGNDVRPYAVDHFSIAPGETLDVLVRIQKNSPYIIYAEARDTLGAALGALITSPHQCIDYKAVRPFPEPQTASQEMMSMMMEPKNQGSTAMPKGHMNHIEHMGHMGHMSHMDHSMANHAMSMRMPTEPSIIGDRFYPPTSTYATSMGTKYQPMVAAVPTNDPLIPVSQVIRMELFGYMDRFIWFINGVPEYNAHPIPLHPGKRYRFVFTNNSMMHHPMHIHGHWFILRKGEGNHDPLLHTMDVPPGATITADVDTDASGQWFFHCHMLYHMITGMSRVFQYDTLIAITKDEAKPQHIIKQTAYHNRPIVRVDEARPIDTMLVKHPMAHQQGFWFASLLDIGASPFTNNQRLTYKGLYGPDYHKLELFSNDAEVFHNSVENADIDIFYWHLLNQFWAVKGGINYFNKPAKNPYWQPGFGIEGLMPYFIDTDLRIYLYRGSIKLDLELSRDTQITNNFLIRTGLRTIAASKTIDSAELGNGLNQMRYVIRPYYRLVPGLNIFLEYENEENYGAFKAMEIASGESATQNTVTLGFTMIF